MSDKKLTSEEFYAKYKYVKKSQTFCKGCVFAGMHECELAVGEDSGYISQITDDPEILKKCDIGLGIWVLK